MEDSTGYRDPSGTGQAGDPGGGVTTLAAATAAIITARWTPRGSAPDRAEPVRRPDTNGFTSYATQASAEPPVNGTNGHHGPNGHAGPSGHPGSNGHPGPSGHPGSSGYAASNGHAGSNGHGPYGGVAPQIPAYPPQSPAYPPGAPYEPPAAYANGHANGYAHPESAPYPPADHDALPQRVRGSASVAPPVDGPSMFEPSTPTGFEPPAPTGFEPLAPTGFEPPPPPAMFEPPAAFDTPGMFEAQPAPAATPIFEHPAYDPGAPVAFEPPPPPPPFVDPRAYPRPAYGEPQPAYGEPTAADEADDPNVALDPGYVPHPYPPAEAGVTVPAQRPSPDAPTHDDFANSVMSDLAFPAPFEPEPYEAYDPFEPRRRAASDRPTPDPLDDDTEPMLPQRVPAIPDVPDLELLPNDPLRDPATATMSEPRQLSRIATFLRDDEKSEPGRRPDGFDLNAVLDAVRSVPDVSDAHLRWNPDSGHTLRIEFKDGVDEGHVTRQVARLLRESMGLTAAPSPLAVPVDPDEAPIERTGGGRVRGTAAPMPPAAPMAVASPTPPAAPMPPPYPTPPAGHHQGPGADRQAAHPLPPARRSDGSLPDVPRLVLDHVQVTTLGMEATVEVRLAVSRDGVRAEATSVGTGQGPAVDAYLLRLAAQSAGDAIDRLLIDPRTGQAMARMFIEHAAVVPFGRCEVAVVVLLLMGGPAPVQLSGSSIVNGDPIQAVVRATLSAVNRRLESLLS